MDLFQILLYTNNNNNKKRKRNDNIKHEIYRIWYDKIITIQ